MIGFFFIQLLNFHKRLFRGKDGSQTLHDTFDCAGSAESEKRGGPVQVQTVRLVRAGNFESNRTSRVFWKKWGIELKK